jgi:hypothetical protein
LTAWPMTSPRYWDCSRKRRATGSSISTGGKPVL